MSTDEEAGWTWTRVRVPKSGKPGHLVKDHIVDTGQILLGEITHVTRDGLPMEVWWASAYGFCVNVKEES